MGIRQSKYMLCSDKKTHRIRSTDAHLQCFSGKHYLSSIHQSASALDRSIHPPGNSHRRRKQRKDLKENINHPSIDKKAIFHVFLPILTLLFPTQHYFEYFQGAGWCQWLLLFRALDINPTRNTSLKASITCRNTRNIIISFDIHRCIEFVEWRNPVDRILETNKKKTKISITHEWKN